VPPQPGLIIHRVCNGYWFWGRPSFYELWQDPRAATAAIRPDWDLSTPGLHEAWDAHDYSKFHGWDRGVRVARDHAAAAQPAGQARHHAIRDILADLLPCRRDRQCERVKKPPRNTFPAKKRGQTPPAAKATYVITITRKRATASQYVLIHWHCSSKALFLLKRSHLANPGESPRLAKARALPHRLCWRALLPSDKSSLGRPSSKLKRASIATLRTSISC
jgi:hypothetical protein